VTGSRYRKDGGVEGWSFYRKLTSRTANFVTKFALSIDSSDFTGSFRLYKK
jgi:dolichol-phosphate mannosyltransferase